MPDSKKYERILDRFGHYAVEAFHYLALFIIGCNGGMVGSQYRF